MTIGNVFVLIFYALAMIGLILLIIIQVKRAKSSKVMEYLDKKTGVHYLVYSEGGITPKLNADGSLYTE